MMSESIFLLALLAAVYGATMKLADLMDEHGLRWFPGDALLFGILWGLAGSVLVWLRADLANIFLAQMIAYVLRRRLDFLNHALGGTLVILTFLWFQREHFGPILFTIFFGNFVLFGSLRDWTGNTRGTRDWLEKLNEPAWYYYLPPAIYSLVTGNWWPTLVLVTYRTAYNAVKYLSLKYRLVNNS